MKKRSLFIMMCFLVLSSVIAQNNKFGKVSKEALEEKFYPLDSTADAAYLLKEKNVYYEYDGSRGWALITKVHERIKIYTKEGFSYANKQENLYNSSNTKELISGLKGYTFYLENGKVKKEKMSKKAVFKDKKNKNWTAFKFTLPKVNKGVVLDYVYTIRSPFYTYVDNFVIQEDIPIKKLKVVFKSPEYFIFSKKTKGYLSIPIIASKKNRTISYSYRHKVSLGAARTERESNSVDLEENVYTTNLTAIPALKKEPFVSNINNYRAEIVYELAYTKFPGELVKPVSSTWKSVVQNIYNSGGFGGELRKTSYFKKDIEVLIANTKNDFEKVAAIYQYVKSKVKWNGSYSKYTEKGVRKTYKEGVGNVADINLMLTSMLRYAGLDANPVLISSRNHGVPIFPTLKGFNYVISMITFPDGAYALLDATEPYGVINLLPIRALNWQGRKVVKGGNSNWVPLSDATPPAIESNRLNIELSNDGEVTGMLMRTFRNHSALNFRKKKNHLKEEAIITQLEDDFNIEIDEFKIANKKKLSKPILVRSKFTSEDLVEKIQEKLYVTPLLFLATKKNPFKLDDRKYPVDFGTPWEEKNTVSIKIPEGYKVAFLPKSFGLSLPEELGVFKYVVKKAGNNIMIVSLIQFEEAVIGAKNYSYLKNFFKEIVEKQSEKIILEKKE